MTPEDWDAVEEYSAYLEEEEVRSLTTQLNDVEHYDDYFIDYCDEPSSVVGA